MRLAVSKDVQDELSAIRAELQMAMRKLIMDRHYGAAERMLVIVDRGLNNLIRDAAVMGQSDDQERAWGLMVVTPRPLQANIRPR